MDVNAMELIAGVASAVLERRSNGSLHAQIAGPAPLVKTGKAAKGKMAIRSEVPAWTDLHENTVAFIFGRSASLALKSQRCSLLNPTRAVPDASKVISICF